VLRYIEAGDGLISHKLLKGKHKESETMCVAIDRCSSEISKTLWQQL